MLYVGCDRCVLNFVYVFGENDARVELNGDGVCVAAKKRSDGPGKAAKARALAHSNERLTFRLMLL